MKKLVILLFLVPVAVFGQSVKFSKSTYLTGENVTGRLSVKTDGVENSVGRVSMGAIPAGSLNLGSNDTPGFYPVRFFFGGRTEQYCILVLPPGNTVGSNPPAISPSPVSDSRYSIFLKALIEYTQQHGSYLAILNRVATNYAAAHPVDGPLTIVVCIAAPVSGGNPIFVLACRQGAESLAKDFVGIMLTSLNEELYARNKYGQSEYNFFKGNIASIQYLINAYTAAGFLDTIGAVATATATDAGDQVAFGASLTDQLIKKYQFVLKFKP